MSHTCWYDAKCVLRLVNCCKQPTFLRLERKSITKRNGDCGTGSVLVEIIACIKCLNSLCTRLYTINTMGTYIVGGNSTWSNVILLFLPIFPFLHRVVASYSYNIICTIIRSILPRGKLQIGLYLERGCRETGDLFQGFPVSSSPAHPPLQGKTFLSI